MKKILTLLIVVSGFFSCSRDNSIQQVQTPPKSEATLQFKFQDEQKKYSEVAAARVKGPGINNFYSIVASKDSNSDNIFSITIITDSLRIGTYMIMPDNVAFFREGNIIATNMNGQGLTLHLLTNSGGFITGTFSGTLYNQTMSKVSAIAEGTFSKVKVQYN